MHISSDDDLAGFSKETFRNCEKEKEKWLESGSRSVEYHTIHDVMMYAIYRLCTRITLSRKRLRPLSVNSPLMRSTW